MRIQFAVVTASLIASFPACGAVITDLSATWPTTPLVQTIDALSVTHANRAISGTRVDRQSFTVTSNIDVDHIILSASNYNNNAFNISIFEVSGVNSTSGAGSVATPGPQVGSTITVQPFGSTATGDRNLRIDLDLSEQFTLLAKTSPAGYLMQIQLTNTSSPAAFNWVHSNTGADIYSGGRYRRDDGDTTNTRDFGLALCHNVPEPTGLAVLSIAGTTIIRRRKV